MDINQYFSFSRIGLVMKRDLMENWKTNLYRLLGPYVAFLMIMLLGYIEEKDFESYFILIHSAFMVACLMGGIFYASTIMENMRTQQSRISYLMMPATMLEKFVARALFVTLGFIIMVVCALLLAEATRFLFLPLFELPDTFQQSVLPYIWEKITIIKSLEYSGPGAEESHMVIYLSNIALGMYLLWIHSFFILGGCYWRKHPFWKVLGTMLVFTITFVFIMVHVEEIIDDNLQAVVEWIETNMDWITPAGMLSFVIALLSILIMLNWWLSYKVFTRTQVIKPKFRLL